LFSILCTTIQCLHDCFALKHGANLVWGPEMVDKAILNAERVADRELAFYLLAIYSDQPRLEQP